jgi:hypothetical protein
MPPMMNERPPAYQGRSELGGCRVVSIRVEYRGEHPNSISLSYHRNSFIIVLQRRLGENIGNVPR